MNSIKNFINWYCNTPWHRWWVEKIWKPSWTKLTAWVAGLPSILLVIAEQVGKLAGDDKVSQLLAQMHVPDGFFAGLALVSLIFYIAGSH